MRMRAISARGRFAAQNMNAQPVADARSVSEMPAGRVPGPRKEPTRQQIENVSGEKPANSARSRVWEKAEAAQCARNCRTRSWSRRMRVANRPYAVFRATAANWQASTRQKKRTKRSSQREHTLSSAAEIPSERISAQEISTGKLNWIDYA